MWTMLNHRSSSSTAASTAPGSSRMIANCSGCRNNANVPNPSMFDVVSCPAMSNRSAIPASSPVPTSSPCSRTNMPNRSSPGSRRARNTSSRMYSRDSNWTRTRSSGVLDTSSN